MGRISTYCIGLATFCFLRHRRDPETPRLTRLGGWRVPQTILVVGIQLVLGLFVVVVPDSAQQNPAPAIAVRPCAPGSQDAGGGQKPAKTKKKRAGQAETDAGSACLEVHSSSLDVQERVQAFVREQKWHVGEEQIGEAFLSFSMALTKDDLLGYAKPDAGAEKVQWRSGKVVVLVKTADLNDGYARTIVSAHFEGFGESDDAFAVQRSSWTLKSNGKLEAIVINGLQAHYRAAH